MITTIKVWIKKKDTPFKKRLYKRLIQLRRFEIPAIKIIYIPILYTHKFIASIITNLMRIFYWTPLFKLQISSSAKGLYLYGGLPYVNGNLKVTIGENCRISAATTITGRGVNQQSAKLMIGNNVGIGWQTTIAVGDKIIIEDNVRISGRSFLAGYPGHPIDPQARALGESDTDNQVKNIHIKKNAWLATNVIISSGVTIGQNTIVAAGSVVTTNLPDNVIAAGVPAKVITDLKSKLIKENPK